MSDIKGQWRKSSRSQANGGSCFEARKTVAGPRVDLRDSKLGDDSPILDLSLGDWRGLLSIAGR